MKDEYVVVVGGINIDIGGRSAAPLIPRDSNPGTVCFSMGGVGRNIAHNLVQLGVPVRFLTAVGDDAYAAMARRSCEEVGLGLQDARFVPGGRTSVYLFIDGPEGDMELAVCDAALAAAIDPEYLAEKLDVLNGAAAVVLDGNLTAEAIAFLGQHCTAPLFADPVSVSKGQKLQPIVSRLYTMKPNRIEAQAMTGVDTGTPEGVERAAKELLRRGVRRVFISLGADGLFCAAASESGMNDEMCQLPCLPVQLKNATGGGDAMMAALVAAYLDGRSLSEAGRFALAASALTVEYEETINPNLTGQAAEKRAGLPHKE